MTTSKNPPRSLRVGDKLAGYHVRRFLGATRRGSLWLADRTGSAGFVRTVMIRFLPAQAQTGATSPLDLQLAAISSRLSHPGIMQVEDIVEHHGGTALVLDYVSGFSLADVLGSFRRRHRRMRAPIAASLVAQICETLDFAHGNPLHSPDERYLHRGLSPSAVLITKAGRSKLLDCGFITLTQARAQASLLLPHAALPYQPAERIRDGLAPGPRSDVYACGALLYELLTGCQPFAGLSATELRRTLQEGARPQHPQALNSRLDDALAGIVWTAMAPLPDARHGSAAELRAAIDAELVRLGGRASTRQIAGLLEEAADGQVASLRLQHDGELTQRQPVLGG